jgi:hypothetical protein
MFLDCLRHPEAEVYLAALQFVHGMRQEVLVVDRRDPEPSTNYDVYVMREIGGSDKKLLESAVPTVVERLRDRNSEARKLATNILLELNPKAAKQAGSVVVPPYSFYAK